MRNRSTLVWFTLFLVPLAFDYKGEENGSHLAQILLAAPSIGAGLVLLAIAPRPAMRSPLRTRITAALALTLVGSLVPQLVWHNDAGNYLRVLLPFVLFALGYAVARHDWNAQHQHQLTRVLFWAMMLSLGFTFIKGILISSDLESVRFRIVSPTILCVQALVLHEFVLSRRASPLLLAVFAGTVLVELLSVTRSLVVGTVLLFCYANWLAAPDLRHLLRAGLRTCCIAVLIGATAFGAMSMFPEVASHWTQRVYAGKTSETGMDPTTVTRLAEIRYQYDEVTASPSALLTGMGYGHNYRYSPAYLWALAGQMTDSDFYAINDWNAGHNFWVYQLYAGGLLFGLGLPAAILFGVWRGSAAFRFWRRRAPDLPSLPVLGRSLLMTASLLAMSIGGNPLGPRFSGLVFGFALGLLAAAHARISLARRTSPPPRLPAWTVPAAPALPAPAPVPLAFMTPPSASGVSR